MKKGLRALLADRVLVIAEIGVNHDGSEQRAIDLVWAAKRVGADAVKLQVFRADRLMHGSSAFAKYQADRVADSSPADMLRRFELDDAAVERVVEEIRRAELKPIVTPFSPGDIELVARIKPAAVKIASPDLANPLLLQEASRLQLPLIVSTGASTMSEVATGVKWLKSYKADFALLHCISSYPVPAQDAHIAWIAELGKKFKVPIGYSDHTNESLAGAAAVAAGSVIIEKHLTYDRAASGPDHSASFDPAQFAEYVSGIRKVEALLGTGGKRVLEVESDVRNVSRQSLVLARNIKAGRKLTRRDLTVQRPGTGIPAAQVAKVIGRRIIRNVQIGEMLDWGVIGKTR